MKKKIEKLKKIYKKREKNKKDAICTTLQYLLMLCILNYISVYYMCINMAVPYF